MRRVRLVAGWAVVAFSAAAARAQSGSPDSNIVPGDPTGTLAGIYSNLLRRPGNQSFIFTVRNEGTSDTTYTILATGPFTIPHPEMYTQRPILAGEVIAGGAEVTISADQPSGAYLGTAVVHNDMNLMDYDDTVSLELEIYDPALLTQNGPAIDLRSTQQLVLGNAPPGPHAGALRAPVRLTQVSVNGSGFTLLGPGSGASIGAGQSLTWTAGYNPAGALSGAHMGSVTIQTEMFCPRASYLNGAQAVPAAVWQLGFDQADRLALTQDVAAGASFASLPLYVNDKVTAATLAAGQSSFPQTIAMQLGANPDTGGATGRLVGSALDMSFSAGGDLYVLEMTYDPAAIPADVAERELRLLSWDPAAQRWALAIASNSDLGAGATVRFESFASYLSYLDGAPPELSVQGVDLAEHRVWAVLDHATVFGAGIIVPEPAWGAPLIAAGTAAALMRRRGYSSR